MSYLVSMGSTQPIILLMADGLRGFVQSRRAELGLTQKELALAAGINQPTVSDIERGQTKLPAADIRRGLAKALGVSHLDLLIAAGEITEAELGTSVGIVEVDPDDPRHVLRTLIDEIRWNRERMDSALDILTGMAARDKEAKERRSEKR